MPENLLSDKIAKEKTRQAELQEKKTVDKGPVEKGTLVVQVVKCIDLPPSLIDTPDAYVKLRLSKGCKEQ